CVRISCQRARRIQKVGWVCDLCGAGGFVEHTIPDLDHGRRDPCRYQPAVEVLRAAVLSLGCAAAMLFAGPSWADSPDGPGDVQTPDAGGVQPAAPSPNLSEGHWYNQLPFIPVP